MTSQEGKVRKEKCQEQGVKGKRKGKGKWEEGWEKREKIMEVEQDHYK